MASSRFQRVGFAILKEGYEVLFGLFLTIPFVVAGIIQVVRQKRLRTFGTAILSLWIINFLFGERFSDVLIQLPVYALLGVIGGLGFHTFSTILTKGKGRKGLIYVWSLFCVSLVIMLVLVTTIKIGITPAQISIVLPITFTATLALYTLIFTLLTGTAKTNKGKINHSLAVLGVPIILIGVNSLLLLTMVNGVTHDLVEHRDTVIAMSRVASTDYLVVGGWNQGILFEHCVFHKSYTKYWINTEWLFTDSWGKSKQVVSTRNWQNSVSTGREIWLLENYPTLFSDLQNAGYTIEPFRNIYRAKMHN